MTKTKKSKLSPKESKNKTGLIIIILLAIIVAGLTFYKIKDKNIYQDNTIYYTGDIYSANHAANMIDYLDEGNNVILSPLNVNTSLAILYNGTDNNSNKELKKYFKKTSTEVNEEMANKIESIKEIKKETNNFDKLYESYIKELEDKSYTTLTVDTISLLKKEEQEKIVLLLRKIELSLERIKENNKLTEKNIKEYVLTNKELEFNNYLIKEKLDNVLSDYELYSVNNSVKNNTQIYSNGLNEETIHKEFTDNTSIYTYEVKPLEQNIQTYNARTIIQESSKNEIIINNNLEFNYSWQTAFDRKNVNDAEFFDFNNEVQAVEMMYSVESYYLENNMAKGFKYDFEKGKYSFVGILPKKHGEFTLSEINLDSLLLAKKEAKTLIGVPKMQYQSEVDIKSLLANYNVKEIFTKNANFTKATDENIVINQMTQKNNLTIAEKGTMKSSLKQTETSKIAEEYTEEIILNRPYSFLIINNETNDIMFVGKVVKVNNN